VCLSSRTPLKAKRFERDDDFCFVFLKNEERNNATSKIIGNLKKDCSVHYRAKRGNELKFPPIGKKGEKLFLEFISKTYRDHIKNKISAVIHIFTIKFIIVPQSCIVHKCRDIIGNCGTGTYAPLET